MKCSSVPRYGRLAYFREPETDEKYKHVSPLLRAFLIRTLHCTNVFLSKKSVIFIGDKLCLYRTIATENEYDLVTDMTGVQDKTLQLMESSLSPHCSAQSCTDLPKHTHTNLEAWQTVCKHHEECVMA